ncbi:MFS transporter [Steroidobacter sp. S1-65]|uniref:MFS transporter n=2 Tax=Steroidobacter gossypii TaxID=2805490 RepID=A0ABS1X0T2_9GAMM|nr:MFS transporter [Steroidobacter gossypii]
MMSLADTRQNRPPSPPWGAIAVSTFGAVVGATMPLAVILSMPDVSGGLSASADEASWIVTLYNVGVLVGLPAAVAVAGALGRRRAMLIFGLGLVLTSFAIGVGVSLPWIFVGRFAQGFFGGALPLLMMLIALTSLPPGKGQFEGLTLFAFATTVSLGLSAWTAETLVAIGGWRALFISQAILGAIYTGLAFLVLRGERGNLSLLKSFDWPGFVLLSIGLGLIVIFLSEGERRFWFEKWWITASLICGLLSIGFAIHNMRLAQRPLLAFSIFSSPTFSGVLVLQVIFRFGTLLAVFIGPQYLARLQGFRTEQLGDLMLVMALGTLLTTPVAYWLTAKSDPRIPLSLGLAAIAIAAAICVQITSEWAGNEFILPLALAGAGQALFSVATMRYAVFGATLQDGPSRGIAFNVARTFGLVGGLALTTHAVVERQKFHWSSLSESVTSLEPIAVERLAAMGRMLGSWIPDISGVQRGAFAGLAQGAARQAYTLAYQDAFFITAVALALAAILVWALPALPRERSLA